jgi:hypothetical protein
LSRSSFRVVSIAPTSAGVNCTATPDPKGDDSGSIHLARAKLWLCRKPRYMSGQKKH